MAALSLSYVLLGIASLAFLAGYALSAIAWLRYRTPDTSWLVVFMSPLFVASPSYFRTEAATLRHWAIAALSLAIACFHLLFEGLSRTRP